MQEIEVDITELIALQKDLSEMKSAAIGRLAERGYQVLSDEIYKTAYKTGNLLQGVARPQVAMKGQTIAVSKNTFGKTTVNYDQGWAKLTVSARSARRGASSATLHLKSGQTKQITLRSNPAFNYAETVARGRPAIRAKRAKALLIPVSSIPLDESYITANGQIYIVRPSAKAVKANPYDQRAAKRIENEAPKIIAGVVDNFK